MSNFRHDTQKRHIDRVTKVELDSCKEITLAIPNLTDKRKEIQENW